MNAQGFPGATALASMVFVISVAAMLGGAILAVVAHRIIRCVCGLALCCVGLAGLYVFLGNPFLALMQVLIYVGAVCITIVFAVMLAEPDEPAEPRSARGGGVWLPLALLVSVGVGGGLAFVAARGAWVPAAPLGSENALKAIGVALLTTHSLAFEVISVVLLVAIVGALAIAHGGRGPVK